MADESVMKITYTISTALVLGSALVSASAAVAEEAGVGSVELIPFPAESPEAGNLFFSGDGSTVVMNQFIAEATKVYVHRDGEWALAHRSLDQLILGPFPAGVSEDGAIFCLSGEDGVTIRDGFTTISLPRSWRTYDDGHPDWNYGSGISAGSISSDSRVVTLAARTHDDHHTDALLWSGGEDLLLLSEGLPQDGISYGAGIVSDDGLVVAFKANYYGPINNVYYLGTDREVWVWSNGQTQQIEHLNPGYEVVMRLADVSGNGEMVVGSAQGLWYEGFRQPLTQPDPDGDGRDLVHGPKLSWTWTAAEGTRQITDPRYAEMTATSVDQDASIVLGYGTLHDGTRDQFLWLRSGQVVRLSELLYTLNISIKADWFSFSDISDDGTKLMGHASVNGIYHAIIVTIPDLTP